METVEDFCHEIREYYPKIPMQVIEAIRGYFSVKKVSEDAFDLMYKDLITNFKAKYKQYPDLRDILDIVNSASGLKIILDSGDSVDLDKSYVRVKRIWETIVKGGWARLPMEEKEFYAQWDFIMGEADICKELGMNKAETRRHLEMNRERVIQGKKIVSICQMKRVKRELPEVQLGG